MNVYFDESYDNARNYLLYGALFVPPSSTLHSRFETVREATGFTGEVKYTKCRNRRALSICKKVIDAFFEDEAYFRCVVVEQHRFDYSHFGRPHEPESIKRARAYKKFAEMLLHPFVAGLNDAVLIADDLKRCRGDAFLEMIVQRFNPEGAEPTFRHVTQVSSSLRQYQCLQVCDLLLGCVLNNLAPPGNQYKIDIRTYLCEKLDVSNFLRTTWRDIRLDDVIASCPSFHVWYWNAKKKPR